MFHSVLVSIKVLKSYLKLIDNIDGDHSFWINNKGKKLTVAQLQNMLNKYFVQHKLPPISANELRDLSVQHFSGKGADVRSLQALRQCETITQIAVFERFKLWRFAKKKSSRNICGIKHLIK